MIERQRAISMIIRHQGITGLGEDERLMLIRTRPLTQGARAEEAAQFVEAGVRIDVALWASGAREPAGEMPPAVTRAELAADDTHIRQCGHV
jgi:hypothetical protein